MCKLVKRRLAIWFVFSVSLMVIMLSAPLTAHAVPELSHVHEFVPYQYVGNITSFDDSGHIITGARESRCECGAVQIEQGSWKFPHSIRKTDIGHVHGTYTHEMRESCRYCDYSKVITYQCSGNPCVYPYSVIPLPY